ncbi:MAG: glycoside hydrolase family 3 C-terminal domain-containing protein [Cytophagaceae bacterium]|jgi:beta-glucosidase|nr:glycoside hydrolase family 3 C-terminal domain-containing protein [Cytophagaceae bacterium]
MIKKLIVASLLFQFLATFAQDNEKRIDEILKQMTLEEKVGQMTQVTLDVISKGQPFDEKKKQEINEAGLKEAIHTYKIGSILNTGTHTLTRDEWYTIIGKIHQENKTSRLKIPVLYGIDAIHGANYTVGATLFPQELALAATWQPAYAEKMGQITAYEVRASAIPWNFSPVLDLGRQPLWSRFFETFGEDQYLATQMGNAAVLGYQGTNMGHPERVAACLKHYVGYSNSKSGKDRTPIQMSERELRELYLQTFKSAIEKGAMTVMINSSEINGTPVHASHRILTQILKDELKFKGFAVTDWEDIIMLHTVHRVAATEKEAVKIAVNAGVDMSMVPLNYSFFKHLVELVNEGQVPMSRIDDAVRRILRVKLQLGLFTKTHEEKSYYTKFGSAEFANASYQAALECVTLCKNQNNILPLKKGKKILVTGVGGNTLNCLNGAWTHTWQGVDSTYNTKGKKTIFQAMQELGGKENVFFVQGTSFDKDVNIAKAVEKAKEVDYIVLCLGEIPATEKVGDIEDLSYPAAQLNLAKALAAAGKPVITILLSSRPRLFTEVEPMFSAVINAYWPGDEGGRALAATLYGDNNPSGKLPYTYPKYSGSLVTYDHKLSEKRDKDFGFNAFNPLYEFGHGLSYTSFEYTAMSVSKNLLKGNEKIQVSIQVKNTGAVEGKEVVQLYYRDQFASITPSVKKLVRFEKISLKPGETKTVRFEIEAKDLAFVGADLKWITEPGKFDLMIGKSSIEISYEE